MIKTKMLAVLMVSLMMAVSVVPILGEDDEVSAAVGDGGYYSYTLDFDSTKMSQTASQENQITVADMIPISHTAGTTTLSTVANEGSWGFNTTTGVGPFNSYYVAFDMYNGNRSVGVLNPYDLTKKIDGTALDDMTKYNIMWILPTVYWFVDSNGDLTLTNDPNAGGVAYAHTIDGHTYNYIGIGVYEATRSLVNEQYRLVSTSGTTTSVSSISDARTSASNSTLDYSGSNAYSMVWNFYQWELYRYCSYTVMEGFNSQNIVGNGVFYSSTTPALKNTGLGNQLGPYAGNPGLVTDNSTAQSYAADIVKLFIENAWGNAGEYVDGVMYSSSNLYIDSSHQPTSSTTPSEFVEEISLSLPNGFVSSISTDAKTWGIGTASSGASATSGLTDMQKGNNNGAFRSVGSEGRPESTINTSTVTGGGISFFTTGSGWTGGNTTRLAFVMDVDPSIPPVDVTINADATGYGVVSPSSITTVPGSTITIDGMTMTIGDSTATASFTGSTDAQYTYSFLGWYNGDTLIENGSTVLSDMTITAKFNRTINNYTVSFAPNNADYGTVSLASIVVPYNTTIASVTNTVTLGTSPDATVVTATPTTSDAQYTYALDSWTGVPVSGYITEATDITASFTQTLNSYTITWVIGETSTTETYDYGEMPTHENPTPPDGYYFVGWNPEIATVTGDQTYTAVFSNMTVTFDPGSGTLQGDASKVVVIGQPIGEMPTCTAPTNYTFDGWYTAATGGTKVTEDTIVTQEASFTLYAQYELVPALQPVKAILDVMPILIAVGLILGAVYVFMTRPELATTNNLLYAIVGISVAVLMLAVIIIPIIGNAL